MELYWSDGGIIHKSYLYRLQTIDIQAWNGSKAGKKLSRVLHMGQFFNYSVD